MSDWVVSFYFFIIGASFLLSVVGLWLAVIMPVIDRWSKRLFINYFSSLMVCCGFSLVDLFLFPHYYSEFLQIVLAFIESFCLSLPLPMLTAYLIYSRGETNVKKNRLFFASLMLWSVFVILLGSTFFTGFVYYFTPDSQIALGSGYPLLILPLLIISAMNFIATLCSKKRLSRKRFFSFIISTLPMTVALLIHTFIDITALVDITIILSAISMFGLIVTEQIEEHLHLQQQIAHERASVMVLQMRPHFIYNTLMSIYSLCNQDPKKARQVTMDFTNYLRKNFNAVGSDSTIPFTAELEHTKAYLAVEQAQHEDMLFVEFDTPFTQFRLPPLTLQPIAENSVKHGMDPYAGPLRVAISVRQTDTGVFITVEDNGKGFDPGDNSKPHPALDNIENRLRQQCGGTLIINSAPGKTTIKIFIPNK